MIDSDDEIQSQITIGGYNSAKYGAEGSELVWHDLQPDEEGNHKHWSLGMEELKMGDYVIENTHIESVIIDSGTSLVLMPQAEFKKFLELIEYQAEVPYSLENEFGLESFPCYKETTYANMPDLSFKIDGVLYTIPPASYIGYADGVCTLKLMTNKRDKHFLTLGLNFFENYYTVFDVESKRIGLQTSRSSKNLLDLEQSWHVSSFSSMLLSLGEVFAELKATLHSSLPLVTLKDWADRIQAYMIEPSIDDNSDSYDQADSKMPSNQVGDAELEQGVESLTEAETKEVRQEFFFTALFTLTVLLAITALAFCQWMQARQASAIERKLAE